MHNSIYHDGHDSGEWDGGQVSEGYEVWFHPQTMVKAYRLGMVSGWYGTWNDDKFQSPIGPFNTRIEAISFFEQEIAYGACDEQFG